MPTIFPMYFLVSCDIVSNAFNFQQIGALYCPKKTNSYPT
jgi:hypothetical protein